MTSSGKPHAVSKLTLEQQINVAHEYRNSEYEQQTSGRQTTPQPQGSGTKRCQQCSWPSLETSVDGFVSLEKLFRTPLRNL